MAGAVSAGAYTAGVIDYLLEALESWQKAKDSNLGGVPKHNVLIEVLGGASAGGMTAAITAAALQSDFPPINQGNYTKQEITEANLLYHSWVNLTETDDRDMMSQLLNTDDIINDAKANPSKEVRSGFNSSFIEKIAKQTLEDAVRSNQYHRPYIACDLELLTTLSNLRGFDYDVKFRTKNGSREHRMKMHRDLVHFRFSDTDQYQQDGVVPLHFIGANGLNKELLAAAAMATGAFPVGLEPRMLSRDPQYINRNGLLRIDKGNYDIVCPNHKYDNVNVDGGIINNEPFELTEQILINRRLKEMQQHRGVDTDCKQETKASTCDTTLLMIDPFPNYDEIPSPNYSPLTALKHTIPQIIAAMRGQLMFKKEELQKTYDMDDYSRFMIAPSRTVENEKQDYPIACGVLGGFGGFFSKQFRIHDYMLGRRNCQKFLQNHFCIPVDVDNPIITYGYNNIDTVPFQIIGTGGKAYLPIIPDIRVATDDKGGSRWHKPTKEAVFEYPSIKLSYLLKLDKPLTNRFGVILSNLANGNNTNMEDKVSPVVQRIRKKSLFGRVFSFLIAKPATSIYLFIGKQFGKSEAAKLFLDMVISDMEKRGLLEEDV